MNIMGKILVFLNLVFALIVGGFLLIDFQTRVDWRQAFEKVKNEYIVAQENANTVNNSILIAKEKITLLEQQLLQAKKDQKDAKDKSDALIASYKKQMEEAKKGLSSDYLLTAKTQGELERLLKENTSLAQYIEKRDKQVLILEQEKDNAIKEMTAALNEKDSAVARLANLQDRLRELELKIAEKMVAKKGGDSKDKDMHNPPPFYVKGLIEKVDTQDNSLVLISLGSDQGIQVGHTMDVYRNKPTPQYLGQIRIEETTARKAVARLLPSIYSSQATLKVGDQVASQITPGL